MDKHLLFCSRLSLAAITALVLTLSSSIVNAQEERDVAPGEVERSTAYHSDDDELEWWQQVIFWIPLRVVDFIDIFRADAGIGFAAGGVLRATPHAQVGYRTLMPASMRAGLFGRKVPFLVETHDEYGVGEDFTVSPDREICPGEVGIGADLILGGYLGICFDEAADFFAGLILLDPKDDDGW